MEKTKIGDEFTATVQQGKNDSLITFKDGLVCLIDKYSKFKPLLNEVWKFAIIKLYEKYAIAIPVSFISSKNGLQTLGRVVTKAKQPKQKVIKSYPYLSKNQIKNGKD